MSEQIDYKALADALLARLTNVTTKAVGSTPTATYGHGPYGLFSQAGLSQPLFSAMTLPVMGLESMLPAFPSRDANPLYGIITGVTATSGDTQNGVCDDPPVAGLTKLCMHNFVFGRQELQTKVYDIDRVGQLVNRGEFTDFRLIGNPFAVPGTDANAPTMSGFNPALVGQNELAKALFEFGTSWRRSFARELYTGNPTNNSAGGGRKYFYGLDTLINTGYRDAVTGVACPAADSIVRSWGSVELSASTATTFVRVVTNIYRNLQYIAQNAGLAPVEWVITMPWSMFYEITEFWPIAYQTYRNIVTTTPATQTLFNSGREITADRDAMRGDIMARTGQYLLIDGQRVPVVLDDAITYTVNAGESFTSSMYFVPLTVLGNTPATYLEYLNYDGPYGAMEFANAIAPGYYRTSDSGRFMWHMKPPTNFCVQMLAKTEPRLLLLAPYLAARLTNIKYTPVAHERDPFTDSSYFVDGGSTSQPFTSFYSPTA